MSKEKSENIEEDRQNESSEDSNDTNDVKTKIDIKMIKDEEFSSDDKAPYAKVREAKVMTLCDTVGLCYLFVYFNVLNFFFNIVVQNPITTGFWTKSDKNRLLDTKTCSFFCRSINVPNVFWIGINWDNLLK